MKKSVTVLTQVFNYPL